MDHHDTGLEHDAETVSIFYNIYYIYIYVCNVCTH